MPSKTPQAARTVLEAGFKIIPGKEEGFSAFHHKMLPLAMDQDGFEAVYGGPIRDSRWLYFGARFASAEQMDTWHRHPQHQAVQRSAYERWWTAVYLRKWQEAPAGEAVTGRIMAETRLHVPALLDAPQNDVVVAALQSLSIAGAERFETLSGEFETQPYQFVGPVEIAPRVEGVMYALITHWQSLESFCSWQQSQTYRNLETIGRMTSEVFKELRETQPRDRLRPDRLQREWTASNRAG